MGTCKTVEAEADIISRVFFSEEKRHRIPEYQRDYSWEMGQWEPFWHEVAMHDVGEKFIGTVMVLKDESDEDISNIVDGQQRISTITILFTALRDTLDQYGQYKAAKKMQKSICPEEEEDNEDPGEDVWGEPWLEPNIASRDFFAEYIQDRSAGKIKMGPLLKMKPKDRAAVLKSRNKAEVRVFNSTSSIINGGII